MDDLRALDVQRHSHEPLLDRVWELRDNVSAYDAVYVALAEALDAVLVTCDGPLARASNVKTRMEFIKPRAVLTLEVREGSSADYSEVGRRGQSRASPGPDDDGPA